MKHFTTLLHNGSYGVLASPGSQHQLSRLTTTFPAGEDGTDDAEVLAERKERVEAVLQEIVRVLEVDLFYPLNQLLKYADNVAKFLPALCRLQAWVRALRIRSSLTRVNCAMHVLFSLPIV